MSNPNGAAESRRYHQARLREMVSKTVSPVIQAKRGPETPVEEAFVRAIYNPDRRLG